jgi:hypothetical protein
LLTAAVTTTAVSAASTTASSSSSTIDLTIYFDRAFMLLSIVIPRLRKIIRSGITFVSRNMISRRFL